MLIYSLAGLFSFEKLCIYNVNKDIFFLGVLELLFNFTITNRHHAESHFNALLREFDVEQSVQQFLTPESYTSNCMVSAFTL